MKYFNKTKTIDELKSEYRRLAKENHPDHGGDSETMKEINAEFDLVFRVMEKKIPAKTSNAEPETAGDFRRKFYTENGWEGSRYNPNLRLRDIAPIIRGYVKDVYPTWRFSVVQEHYSGGCSLYVTLMEAPANIFTEEGIRQWAKKYFHSFNHYKTEEEAFADHVKMIYSQQIQNWDHYYDYMTEHTREVLTDIKILVNSFRYDDSDAQFDYFSTNFYPHFYIGKWNKPLKIVQRTERITHNTGSKEARRISA
jgi:DNA polymerase sigma